MCTVKILDEDWKDKKELMIKEIKRQVPWFPHIKGVTFLLQIL